MIWKRAALVGAIGNFSAMMWFAQYVVSGWLIYLYVVGSLVLMCAAMVWAE